MSGRSSRSTLIAKKSRLSAAAIAGSSNDSCSMTWHQWHVEYPMDRKIGFSSRLAASNASSPQAYQSTGLLACCSKYGLRSRARRFAIRLIVSWTAKTNRRDQLRTQNLELRTAVARFAAIIQFNSKIDGDRQRVRPFSVLSSQF